MPATDRASACGWTDCRDDVKLAVGIRRHEAVYEVEELDPPAPPIVATDHLAGGDLQGSEQRRRSMPLVVV